LSKDILEELGLLNEYITKFVVVKATCFVELSQFLAQRNALLPALSLVEVFEDLEDISALYKFFMISEILVYFMIKSLFALPLWLTTVVEGSKALGLPIPTQHGGIKF